MIMRPTLLMITVPATVVIAIWLSVIGIQFGGSDAVSTEVAFVPTKTFPIEIIGNEFHWDFRYPGPDGVLGTDDDHLSKKQLYLPTGSRASVKLTSDDYVYIFSVNVEKNNACSDEKKGERIDHLTQVVSSKSTQKQRAAAIPNYPREILLQTNDSDRVQLMVDPGCGFVLIHDPVMGEIVVTDEFDYSKLLPSSVELE